MTKDGVRDFIAAEYTLSENYVHGLAAFGPKLKNFESPHSSRGSSPGLPAGNSVTDLSVLWNKYRKDTQLLLVLTVSDGAGRSMTDDRFSPLCARACGEPTLRPFSTGVIKTILTEHYPTRKPDDLLPLFAVTGGIPQYIKVLTEAGCTSARQMIRPVAQPPVLFPAGCRNAPKDGL